MAEAKEPKKTVKKTTKKEVEPKGVEEKETITMKANDAIVPDAPKTDDAKIEAAMAEVDTKISNESPLEEIKKEIVEKSEELEEIKTDVEKISASQNEVQESIVKEPEKAQEIVEKEIKKAEEVKKKIEKITEKPKVKRQDNITTWWNGMGYDF